MKKEKEVSKKSDLMSKMLSSGKIACEVLSESLSFNDKEIIQTDIPVLNIAFSGEVDGGIVSGLTLLAGESRSYKTLLGLYCMKAFLDKNPEGVAILYDSEFGVTTEYLNQNGIDPSRVLHIPIESIESLKFDFVARLKEFSRDEKVFVLIDSIGSLASEREVQNALNENSAADMTRAKELKSLFRIITPQLTMKDIPCIAINHTYKEMGLYPKTIVSGGSGPIYSANYIFIITKQAVKNKKTNEIEGYTFTITIDKSRLVKEKSKLPFNVYWDGGIDPRSSLFELAISSGFIIQSGAWYQLVDLETGEIAEKKIHQGDIPDEFYDGLLVNENFKKYVRNTFKIQSN